MVVISVSLSAKDLREFDEISDKAGFSSRSDAVRDAMHRYVSGNNWANRAEGRAVCAVSIIYSDRKKLKVHEIIHDHSDIVRSSLHTHMDSRCMEQMVLEGEMEEIKSMMAQLSAQKDIHLCICVL